MTDFTSFSRFSKERLILIVGFILLIVSAFLPWLNYVTIFGVVTLSGLQVASGEPGIVGLLFAIIGVLLIWSYSNTKRIRYISLGFAIWMFIEVGSIYVQSSNIIAGSTSFANIGSGLYLCALSALILFLGGVYAVQYKPTLTPPPQNISISVPKKYCVNCGAPLLETASYCGECGRKVEK